MIRPDHAEKDTNAARMFFMFPTSYSTSIARDASFGERIAINGKIKYRVLKR